MNPLTILLIVATGLGLALFCLIATIKTSDWFEEDNE